MVVTQPQLFALDQIVLSNHQSDSFNESSSRFLVSEKKVKRQKPLIKRSTHTISSTIPQIKVIPEYVDDIKSSGGNQIQLQNLRVGVNKQEHREHRHSSFQIPKALLNEYEIDYKLADDTLLRAMENPVPFYGDKRDIPFADILLDAKVPDIYSHKGNDRRGDKFILGPRSIREKGSETVVYSFGCADIVDFEIYMSSTLGSSVFAFDCTTNRREDWGNTFTFYPWCLGEKQSFDNNYYTKNISSSKQNNFQFYKLFEIKKMLNHESMPIDILKMDIEGFEWEVLETEIIKGKRVDLPYQLLFELHTQGSNAKVVPKDVVSGKTRNEVNILIHQLRIRGYRCISVIVNSDDRYCAEIVMARID